MDTGTTCDVQETALLPALWGRVILTLTSAPTAGTLLVLRSLIPSILDNNLLYLNNSLRQQNGEEKHRRDPILKSLSMENGLLTRLNTTRCCHL